MNRNGHRPGIKVHPLTVLSIPCLVEIQSANRLHPQTQGPCGWVRQEQVVCAGRQSHDLVLIDRLDQRLPGREVAVESGHPDPSEAGDLTHGRLGVRGREYAGGCGEHALAVADRVGAALLLAG
jgi:hypothetical protein